MLPHHEGHRFSSSLACLSLMLIGCSSHQTRSDAAPDDSHIKPLTMLYVSYMNRSAGRRPANQQEFKNYIAKRGEPLLNSAGISSVEDLFVSPRDNEPYVVLYGNEDSQLISSGVVMHERSGVGGRRLVGYRMGYVNEVDDAEFRKLVPAP
jgi:hypothetical protein